jgi:hypothetical protein
MTQTIVDNLYNESIDTIELLQSSGQVSDAAISQLQFTKVFVLSAASYFEDRIQDLITDLVNSSTQQNNAIISFVKKKAISLQYHTYFDWGTKGDPYKVGNNTNTFLSMFGDECKKALRAKIEDNDELKEAEKAFLEIGHMRNILVHSNFAVV